MSLAERAARWSGSHWKTATLGWLGLVAVAVLAGSLAGTRTLTDGEQAVGGSGRADRILADGGFKTPARESVLVRATAGAATDPVFRASVQQLAGTLDRLPQVEHARVAGVSKDGRSELVEFDVAGDPNTADARVKPALDAVAAFQRAHPWLTASEAGDASAARAVTQVVDQDLHRAEWLSVPVTFGILLFVFGAFVAAGVPVILALSAVLGTIGLGAALSHVVPASETTANVVVLMGMAVGVDYSLFYLKREREERARGRAADKALYAAAATSGRAVLISGLTVVVACAGMLLSGSPDFVSLGLGAMLVVLVAMAGSLTVLPALLGRLQDRVDRGIVGVIAAGLARVVAAAGWEPVVLRRLRDRQTLLQRLRAGGGESRLWGAVVGLTLRRPRLAAVGAVASLALLAVPALGMRTAEPGVAGFPQDLPVVKAFTALQREFPGSPLPAAVAVRARDVNAPAVRAGIADLRRLALASGVMHEPIEVTTNAAHTVARIDVPLAGNGDDRTSFHALEVLRSRVVPASLGTVPGVETAVTGETADSYDFSKVMSSHRPLVFGFVIAVTFVLLLLAFGSLVVPLTAILMNMLSVGAAYGVLVWIFQQGHLQGLLGFHSSGAIVPWLPLFLFTVLFGLSMDYHVFIVSRIKELVRLGHSTEQAVALGIRSTASTVTSAAAVMIAVFTIFALAQTLVLKQLGVGLAVAVLIDATLIRGVLLPAVMSILGDWNWYLPRRLARLPRLTIEPLPPTRLELD
jgi:uncharacterized membrane protein YdfJ with MMPL/SSD domain